MSLMTLMTLILLLLILLLLLIMRKNAKNITEHYSSRGDIFSRFKYQPSFVPLAPANHKKRRIIIQGRPYQMNEEKNSWYNPWFYPEYSDKQCFTMAEERCNEKLDLNKDVIHTTKCWNSVYGQCVNGVSPLKIKVPPTTN